jgi:hypothetical protein
VLLAVQVLFVPTVQGFLHILYIEPASLNDAQQQLGCQELILRL